MATLTVEEQRLISEPYTPLYSPWRSRPVLVKQRHANSKVALSSRPWLGPLLFDNVGSDARDHCANERTFLSWLRLASYLSIVSVAIMLSFHLKRQPTPLERRMALPFGLIFWLLSLACLANGVANYCKTVSRYSRRAALAQSGWKTQAIVTIVAVTIIAACILFLATGSQGDDMT